jgi:hypothetical protein
MGEDASTPTNWPLQLHSWITFRHCIYEFFGCVLIQLGAVKQVNATIVEL